MTHAASAAAVSASSTLPSSVDIPMHYTRVHPSPTSLATVSSTHLPLRTVSTGLQPLSGQPSLEIVDERIPHMLNMGSGNPGPYSQLGCGSVTRGSLLTTRQLPLQSETLDHSQLLQHPREHAVKSMPFIPKPADGDGFKSGARAQLLEPQCVDSTTQTLLQESKGVQTDDNDDPASGLNMATRKPAIPGNGNGGKLEDSTPAVGRKYTYPESSRSPGPLEVADLLASDKPTPERPKSKEDSSHNREDFHLSNLSTGEYQNAQKWQNVGLALESIRGVDLATKDVPGEKREYHTASSDPAELVGKSTRSNDNSKRKGYHANPVGGPCHSDIASERREHHPSSGRSPALAKEPDTTPEGVLEDEGLLLSAILNEPGGFGGSDIFTGAGVGWGYNSTSDEDEGHSESYHESQ